MIASAAVSKRALSMFGRVFPRTSMIAQAIAFNLFLAFFPTLLIAVGLATSPIGGRTALFDLISDLTSFLPPGSQQIVSEFLVKRGPEAWKWALVGLGGTLLAGTQVMRLSGGRDSRSVRAALAAMAGIGVRKRRHSANVVGCIFSWRRYFAGHDCGYDHL